jgi:hypothetical protein
VKRFRGLPLSGGVAAAKTTTFKKQHIVTRVNQVARCIFLLNVSYIGYIINDNVTTRMEKLLLQLAHIEENTQRQGTQSKLDAQVLLDLQQ